MSVKFLLSDIAHISEKHDLINKNIGAYFNVFDILGVSYDEVSICKFIYELINPKGSHYQGYLYLKLFIENVLHMNFSDYEYKKAIVCKEHVIKNERRIDLTIDIADKKIPIEVKIYAKDQNRQCFDYYKFYAKNSNVFYLTLDGKAPSKGSAEGLTENGNDGYEEVSQISFERDILNWLNQCISQTETVKIAPIRETILQFIGVVRSMTNQLEQGKEHEIVNLISSSKENMKNALEIKKSLEICNKNMIKKVLSALEERTDKILKSKNMFGENIKMKLYSYKDNSYSLVETYYNKKASTYPGLSYIIKKLDDEVDLLFRFEIDYCLFAGFCTSKNGKSEGKQLNKKEIQELISSSEDRSNGWWVYWEHLPQGEDGYSPNFKEFNEANLDLFDDDKFEQFIDLCEKKIIEIFRRLKL